MLKSDNSRVLDQIRYDATNIALMSVDGKVGGGIGSTFDIAGLVKLDVGLVTIDGKVYPGIGVHKTFTGEIANNTSVRATVGVMNLIPYLAVGIDKRSYGALSTSENITERAKTYGLTANISTIGWGISGSVSASVE